MDEKEVFAFLGKQKKTVLLDYLRECFAAMNGKQQRTVFGDAVPPPVKTKANAGKLLADIDRFRKDSLAGEYYAPFNVNSKNYMDIPEETDEWLHLFAQYAEALSKLDGQKRARLRSHRL